jgi:SHS2 domain-containing protein
MQKHAGRSAALAPSHAFLEHTGELHLRVRAGSLAGLLAEAGRALAGLLLRGAPRKPVGRWEEAEVRSTDRAALLVDWLNELIYRAESGLEVPTEFEVREVSDTVLRVRLRGVAVDEPPALVKAATLHGAKVEAVAGGLQGDVVLDV